MPKVLNYTKAIFLLLFFCKGNLIAQNNKTYTSERIQNLINVDSLDKAHKELLVQTEYYSNNKQYDSLSNLTYYYGRIAKLKGEDNYIEKSKTFLNKLKKLTNNPDALHNAYSDLAALSSEGGMYAETYDYQKLGYEQAKKTTIDRLNKMSNRAYGLSSSSYYLRKFDLVKKHGIESFKINERNPDASPKTIFNAGNIVGLMMQNENKLDSALYYFNKGVVALKDADGDLNERYYYPAILMGNMATVYMNQGKFYKSLKSQETAISNYKTFIDSSANNPAIINIKYNYLSVINGMGSNYVKLGQVERALQLFKFNYNKAKEYFPENSIQQIVYINQYAQGKWVLHDGEAALELIEESYKKFKNLSSGYASYMTYAMGTKASILESLNRIEEAYQAHKYSDELYNIESSTSYSHDRLTKLRKSALFYSQYGYKKDANQTINKIIKAVEKTANSGDLETIKTHNLMSEIQFNLENYKDAVSWSDKTIALIDENKSSRGIDSLFWKGLKVSPLLFKSKAAYKLADTTNFSDVSKIYEILKNSLDILNTTSSNYSSNIDKEDYLLRTKPLIDFTMEIGLKLHEMTSENTYLDYVISLHESTIYNRIRSKLALRDDIKFIDIPQKIQEKETALKDSLSLLRNQTTINQESIEKFVSKNQEWTLFLNTLKQEYPKYHKMRYETIKQSLGNIQNNIPEETTIIRYLFINDNLFAFISDKYKNKLYKLNSLKLEEHIQLLSNSILEADNTKQTLHQLYKQLWEPFKDDIENNNIIIIPDRELFNLSFETLTPKKLTEFEDMSNYSLLSEYTISYNYSLYLLNSNQKVIDYSNDFIAFAPEFSDKMKDNYKVNISDSIALDKTYLKLLPQPFTIDLAKEYSKLFNGDAFVNEKASKKIFMEEAKEHKIIHIGTHAESNNVSPELSRLVFAKNALDDDNSLYSYEIYNQNLSSNLAVLTACETGKPTYQSGEGMISLAHAFNYAGSESILTSLWKIDEQSSSKIIESFYNYISKGLPKDQALRSAKLDYIKTAEGRTKHPQYWAGLVLIGDNSPLSISKSNNLWLWLLGGVLILSLLYFLLKKNN